MQEHLEIPAQLHKIHYAEADKLHVPNTINPDGDNGFVHGDR